MSDKLIELLTGAGLSGLASKLRTISKEDAITDYEKLRSTDCTKINDRALTGNKAIDYFFFEHRLRTKTASGISFPDWLKTNEASKPYYKRLIKNKMETGNTLIQAKYGAFQLYSGSGAISAFKPIIARHLYCKYNPTTILDFSAGWGGRCLGAMSLDKNYIGFDTNTTLRTAYEEMIDLYPTNGNIKIIFKDSSTVDYSKYNYDMVFTSPPYFQKTRPTERYEKMPEYKDREDFNNRFLFPVIKKTYKHLKVGGVYALNIPIDMYKDVKTILGASTHKIPLKLSSRTKETRLGGEYKEFIYVWIKSLTGKGTSLPKHKWSSDIVTVKKSTIPGVKRGVFATQFLKKGQRIEDYKGVEMSKTEYSKKYPDNQQYFYLLGRQNKVIDGRPFLTQNISHYINESKVPNVIMRNRGLYVLKDIDQGEELFLSYPKSYKRDYKV